jgi:hypothetical protein
MRILQWALLGASVAVGLIWVFLFQNWLFLVIFSGLLVGPGLDLQGFLQSGSSPAFSVLWVGCISALLIWLARTMASRPKSSAEVRSMQPQWWLAAALLTGFGWASLGWFTVFQWQVTGRSPIEGAPFNSYPVPPGGWILLFGFVVLDVILLFWLPTMLASPRTYRFVVPGAVSILGSR